MVLWVSRGGVVGRFAQEGHQLIGGFTAMAIVVLDFRRHLCKASGVSFRDEDGVITETVFTGEVLCDVAFADAFEEVFFFGSATHTSGEIGFQGGR